MKKQTIIAALLLATTMSHGKTTPNRTETPANFEGYLFAYFEGRGDAKQQEHLRFALSDDGVNWSALNENRPVIASDTISESGGIRDPHILRGEDGRFYIVATDMNTAKNGWNENPGIVLLSSDDLLHWKHAKINLSKDYPKHFGDAYWVWAPQTIYDRKAKKYMIYFTLQRNDRKSLITYYAYANKDFTGFESEPKQLFSAKYGSIDNDIIEKDGTYHLFYKGNTKDENGKEIKNGIQQATSKSLKGKWKEDFKYLDAYENLVKACRLTGEIAGRYSIKVVIEPLSRKETNMVCTVAEGALLQRDVANENVGMLADYFHICANHDDLNSIATIKDFGHIHIASGNGRRYPLPGDGENYGELFAALHTAGYNGRMSIEGKTENIEQDGAAALAYLKQLEAQNNG